MADLARKHGDLKKEFEQLLQTQVTGFGRTLRQLDDELEALKKKRTEQGTLSPTDNARLKAIDDMPEIFSLSYRKREMDNIRTEYHAAKNHLAEIKAALSNHEEEDFGRERSRRCLIWFKSITT